MTNPYNVPVTRCAGPNCPNVRREANHWFIVLAKGDSFKCWAFDKIALLDEMKPVCGQACAQRLFEQFLSRKGN